MIKSDDCNEKEGKKVTLAFLTIGSTNKLLCLPFFFHLCVRGMPPASVYLIPRYATRPAFALGMGGLVPEAIRKMESLRSKHDVELGVAMALLHFHGKAKMVDR